MPSKKKKCNKIPEVLVTGYMAEIESVIEDAVEIGWTRFDKPSKPSEYEHDISVHGVYIEKDGKRIEPKDVYKPIECEFCNDQEWSREHDCDCKEKDTITIPKDVVDVWVGFVERTSVNKYERPLYNAIKQSLKEQK